MSTKILVAGTSALALTALLAAPAVAGPKYTAENGGSVTWYGQFNPTFQSYDDGEDTTTELVDNVNSNSRLGFKVTQPFGENTLTFTFETALGLRASDSVNQNDIGDALEWTRGNLRKVDFSYKTPSFGTFSIGQGSMASDGAADIDASGTGVVAGLAVADGAGGYLLREAGGALSSIEVGDVFVSYDGSRRGRIRYDSPTYNGFSIGVAYGEDILTTNDNNKTQYDVALRYSNDALGDFEVEGAVAVNWTEDDASASDYRDTVVSFGALHAPTGLSASLAYGQRDFDDAGFVEGDYAFVKLGYTTNSLLSVGATSFSVDYYDGSDLDTAGDSSESFGIAAVQKFDRQNIEAYLAYREYSYDAVGTTYQDGSVILAGARWKF